ncbi:MAG: sensor histidine kinase, partial [Oceanobacter sp.]
YRLVEPLSKDDLNRLQQERQFPGESPSLLYQHRDSLIGLNASGPDVWQIQDTAWLVNHSPIPGMGWTLHQVRKQSEVLLPTLVCLMGLSLVAGLWLMFMAERRKKAEYQLSVQLAEVNRREDLQRLIDNIHIGVLICSEEGGITSMNDYAENLLLAGADFHAGQRVNLVDLLKIQSLQSLEDHLLVKPETPQYAETWTRIGEQPVPVMFAVSRVEYAGRQQYLMTLINIAKRKRAEDELVRLNASLEETVQERTQALESAQKALLQKSKAAALGKMAATIVHELSQPLSAMNSSVAALESKLKRENWDGAAQSASRLKPLSSKMQRVIRMLKHFSYEDQQEAESLDLFALVNQVIEVNQDQLQERGIELSFLPKIPSFSHCVMGSSLKMDLAISNLLRNAMDAAEDQPHPRIQIHLSRDDGWLKLTVQDNGGGVAPALMDQLFDPYVTTKKVGKGIGLGLSITQEVVQQMNGRLEVKNTEGGACFTVLMPGNA